LLDAMVPSMTALARSPASRSAGWVSSTCRWGCDLPRWTPPGENGLAELSPTLQSLKPFVDQLTGHLEPRVEERLPRHRTPPPTPRS
jgi:hypothetical protein